MIEVGKWLILETEQDFLSRWNEKFGSWDHADMKRPNHFPCGFQYQKSFDPHSCGTWYAVSLELVRDNIEKDLRKIFLV